MQLNTKWAGREIFIGEEYIQLSSPADTRQIQGLCYLEFI